MKESHSAPHHPSCAPAGRPRAWMVGLLGLGLLLVGGCGPEAGARRVLRGMPASAFRTETLAVCRGAFNPREAVKIDEANWPASVRAFQPLSLWAEPDGAYLLIDSDADGEHGVYLPRILSDKDPICGPSLKHVKLAEGIYWYDRKRG